MPLLRFLRRLFRAATARPVLEGFNRIGRGTRFDGSLGLCSHVGDGCRLRAHVGRFSSLGHGVESVGETPVSIGNDCWVGNNVTFRGGPLTVHDGAAILAGAVVDGDVPPYAIVAGSPACVIGHRYDPATVATLLDVAWWDNTSAYYATTKGKNNR